MAHDPIISRSFGRDELKKELGFGSLLVLCFIVACSFQTVFELQHVHYSSEADHHELVRSSICNSSNSRSDVLEINGDVRIHGSSSTIFIASSTSSREARYIKPYARKGDAFIMERYVSSWTIDHHKTTLPDCDRLIKVPAMLFSASGYTGNHFHDFTDTLIPLYLTAQLFNRTVLFLIADKRSSWFKKYKPILDKLSSYETLDVNKENRVLCFARTIVGLRSHKEFGIDPLQPPHSTMVDFRKFLRSTFSLGRDFVTCGGTTLPRMLIISRSKNRFITNEDKVAEWARRLGFEVAVQETGWNVSVTAKQVNSFDVMVGVHGAGLTNMVFLPENGVVIQIVPFGADMLGEPYFGRPAKGMGLRYLEYQVSLNESSLLGKYPDDSEVYRDSGAIYKKGFVHFHSVYLKSQDVTLDFNSFRGVLVKAFELVRC